MSTFLTLGQDVTMGESNRSSSLSLSFLISLHLSSLAPLPSFSPFQNKSPITCQVVYYHPNVTFRSLDRQRERERERGRKSDPNRGVPSLTQLSSHSDIHPSLHLSSISVSLLRRSLAPFAVEHNLSAINFP